MELVRDRPSRLGERYISRHVLRHLCTEIDEITTAGHAESLALARLAVRLAGRLTGFCRCRRCTKRTRESEEMTAAFARLAGALRLANRLGHAESALRLAFDLAAPHQMGDLHRRRGWLRVYQDRLPEAIADAESAIDLTRGQARTLSLGLSGLAHLYSGKHEVAIRYLEQAVLEIDPTVTYRYCGMLVSYAAALARGSKDDAEKAVAICREVRSKLKDRHKMQRAKTWWVEGLLHARLGDEQKAWWSLDIARRSLIGLKAAPEVAAVVSDMAAISREPLAVGHICGEAEGVIAEAHPLAEPLRDLARAARELIPEAAAALRRAAHLLAACPSL